MDAYHPTPADTLTRARFPALRVDPQRDVFVAPPAMQTARADLLYLIATRACGATHMDAWRDRLAAVEAICDAALNTADASRIRLMPLGLPIDPTVEPGLTFVLIVMHSGDRATSHPVEQMCGSLALWLLVESLSPYITRYESLRYEAEAALCMDLGCLIGARTDVIAAYRALRSKSARVAANASHQAQRRRWEALLADFAAGSWRSKSQAAKVLGQKYHFCDETVRNRLKRVPMIGETT